CTRGKGWQLVYFDYW
nr:immunoglobulin heavy chain junction region [Macaca mulatta]